ncbi:disks large-associated protein 5 isoform X1 [Pundamilia nyererei]|uniref:Disks large-associated protein 5 isoform X1 n=1 Tax=Pundamilia nyererei TaxID=303518 RepID=A0A9Y6M682_9CICH|nr:PREDICTED: disks large-associated protein 5 isoform X1 [Pundamilia nyererei]
MESRFAHLRQRDTSVSMLRVKMSRRRSHSQKENRERTVNTRRQLDKLPELEMSSLNASIAVANMSTIQEKMKNNEKPAKAKAVEDRLKQLERWKERKALEKEKEKRERERKGVFKIGLYHPTGTITSLPAVPDASAKIQEKKANTAPSQSIRVTRSMKQQQQVEKPLKIQDPNTGVKKGQPAVERSTRTRLASAKPASTTTKTKEAPAVRALSTRSANRPPVPVVKGKPKDKTAVSDARTTRSRANLNPVAPLSGAQRNCKEAVNDTIHHAVSEEPELTVPEMQDIEKRPSPPSPTPCAEEEDMVVDQSPAKPVSADLVPSTSSFAPEGFLFQAPTGLSSFKFEPLTPRSADSFLTPSSSFNLPPAPVFSDEQSESCPPKSPLRSPPHTSPTVAPPSPGGSVETKHDVPYFRSEMANETERLMSLSLHWESKVEDKSIPEEMRDRMRTAVGQARLLMKERFNQFSGLVDDCELGRGEKITTCTDLQGFWDMVYYQVEDVHKKFDALKEAEERGWVEEHKPPPRQKKVVKKQLAASTKPAGTNAAAKARLAAAKAAMKAKKQAAEAEKAAGAANTEDCLVLSSQNPHPQAGAQRQDTVVFDGGFFQVESPAKQSVRRSSHLNAAVLPGVSPCSTYLSPRRVTRRSLALAQTPVQRVHAPAHLRLTLRQTPEPKSQCGTPQATQSRRDIVNISMDFSPVKEVISDDTQPDGCPAQVSEKVFTDIPSVPQLLPAILEPAEDVTVDNPVSPAVPGSPCKQPAVPPAPEPSSAPSFTLSPCATPSQPSVSSSAVQGLVETLCHTPDSTVVEEISGLDFERYLQPSDRCSLSPRDTVATETLSPMAVDVAMESPRGQATNFLTEKESALPVVSSVLTPHSRQVQTAESALLLFTPDLKDKIRQSVCPSDLMVFTPPNI